jgi:predicted Rossmann-fold nucleotide-binding protein
LTTDLRILKKKVINLTRSHVHERHPAIALLGPHTLSDPNVESIARDVGAAVVREGYDLVLLGPGATSRAGAEGAKGTGRIVAILCDDETLPGVKPPERLHVTNPLKGREAIIEKADVLIVLPGDVDALAIVLQIWAWGHEPSADYRQMVLVGDAWPNIVKGLAAAAGMGKRSEAMITFAQGADEAVETVRYYLAGQA